MSGDAAAQKALLRSAGLKLRQDIDPAVREAFAQRLADVVAGILGRGDGRVASAYWPIRNEPDTFPLMHRLRAAGFITALPITLTRAAPLFYRQWNVGEPTVRGPKGVPEPEMTREPADPDILIAPCAVFDRSGVRVGYGGGYFDTTFSGMRVRKPILAIGVAFACQEVQSIPSEPHDQRLDIIITDRDVIYIQPESYAARFHR